MQKWLLTDFLKDLLADKLVKEPKIIYHVKRPLILAENFTDKKTTKFCSELGK